MTNLNQTIEKITHLAIKDNVYNEDKVNDYVIDVIMNELFDKILDEVMNNIKKYKLSCCVKLIDDVLMDYNTVNRINILYEEQIPSKQTDTEYWEIIEGIGFKYGIYYDPDYDDWEERHQCNSYDEHSKMMQVIERLQHLLGGLLINGENFNPNYDISVYEKEINLNNIRGV